MNSIGMDIASKDEVHAEAVRILNAMGVCEPYLKDFEHNDHVYLFKNYDGYRIHPDSRLADKLREIENKYGHKVYAVTYEQFSFGRMYSFLLVSKYRDDWDVMFKRLRTSGHFTASAYVWNLDYPEYSEYGTVFIDSAIGGLRRVG